MKIPFSKTSPKNIIRRLSLIAVSLFMAFVIPMQIVQKVSADQYDDRIAALQQDIDQYNAQATQLAEQAKTLQSEVSQLQSQAAAVQAQIELSQAKYDQLVIQITETEKKIKDNQDALGVTIANMYVEDNITPIEMLAGSKNISNYMDKQEYRSSVRDELSSTITSIKDLKTQLNNQKDTVKIVLDKQQSEKAGLVAIQTQQQNLLSQTQGQESAYQQLVADNKQKMADYANQQRDYYQSLLNNGGGDSGAYGDFVWQNLSPDNGAGGCVDGYPYCQPQDSVMDQWQLYNRECVSYVAWALQYRFNKHVMGFNGYGNAWQWAQQSFSDGKVGSAVEFSSAYRVSDPQPGDAVVLPASGNFAPVGHLMIVESFNGEWIHVSQYNMFGTGQYSTMDIKNSGIILMRFQDQ